MSHELDERREALAECLDKLPPRDRQLMEQRYKPGVTIKSLASAIGRPIEGLYKAMKRIHIALNQCVQRSVHQQGEL